MIAVLTAELVSSTKLQPNELTKVTKWLESYFSNISCDDNIQASLYRGDEFQLVFKNHRSALLHSLLIKLKLQIEFNWPQHCTMSLAFGVSDSMTNSPATSQGPVFISSGRGLSKTKRGELSIHFSEDEDEFKNLLLKYVNHQLNKLTITQVELLTLFIENEFPEHKELAKITNTSRQNISNRLSAMGADLIKEFLTIYKE